MSEIPKQCPEIPGGAEQGVRFAAGFLETVVRDGFANAFDTRRAAGEKDVDEVS